MKSTPLSRTRKSVFAANWKMNNTAVFGTKDVDGALVGGASLDPDSFSEIIRTATSGLRAAPSRRLING
jgi:triosephosphate isomerase